MSKKFTSTVVGASILITTVGLMSRGLGLIREIVFAGSFGLSNAYDLFLVGTVIPLTLNTIVIYIAQNYFIPVYNRIKSSSLDEAKSFIIKSLAMFIVGGSIIMGLLFFFSEDIISLYINNPAMEGINIAVRVLRIYSFTIPFNAAFSVLSAFLYSEFDFKLPTFSQLFVNIAVIVCVLIFADVIGVTSIAFGYLLGIILQLVFVLIYILKSKIYFLSFKGNGKKLFYWDSGLVLIIIIETLSQIYLISDRYFLSQVDKGGIAALNYSMNIFLLPISIISVALATALFPSFSKSFVENNINQISEKLRRFFSVNLYLFVPLTFIYIFFGDIIIRLLFQRGAFSSNDSSITFETLKYFSVSLIFYSSYAVLNKLMYSLELIKQLLLITVLGCSIKVILNFILVIYLKQDGLALSSSLSYIYFFTVTFLIINKRLSFRFNKQLFAEIILYIISAVISYIIVVLLSGFINPNSVILSFLVVLLFFSLYMLNLWVLKTKSTFFVLNLFSLIKNYFSV
jgi:putative peptidoglycan lipid II flippase